MGSVSVVGYSGTQTHGYHSWIIKQRYIKGWSDLPTDPPEAAQTRIRVQNASDTLADSKSAW